MLSLIWAVGAAVHQRNADVGHAQNFATFSYNVCTDGKAPHADRDLASCERLRAKEVALMMQGSWGNVAFIALVPIPIGWLLAIILFYFGKAQVVGFRATVPLRSLRPLQKAFVYFCALFTAALLYFGVLGVLNLYTDSQVPVALSPFRDFSNTGDLVTASGTWVQSENGANSPLQTSAISCRRQEGQCTEATATVEGDTLMNDLNEYPVESWNDSTIVYKDDELCASTVYTIDLKTEAVNRAWSLTNPGQPYCTKYGQNDHQTSQLVAGFPVYWAKRKEARPYLLRLMQAIFGG
jgi:hypothetical protein